MVGLIPDKKVGFLHARGGNYSEGPAAIAEMSLSYTRNIMVFFGATKFEQVIIEGDHQFRDRESELVAEGTFAPVYRGRRNESVSRVLRAVYEPAGIGA